MKLGLWSIQIRLTLPAASEGILSISTRTSGLQRLQQSVPTPPPVGSPGPLATRPRPARARGDAGARLPELAPSHAAFHDRHRFRRQLREETQIFD